MNRQLRIVLTGVFLVAPFAVTVWVIWKVGATLNELGLGLVGLEADGDHARWYASWAGIVIVLGLIYLIGLLAHLLVFRWFMERLERLFERLPGVKTVYCSVRDLMKLFGTGSRDMGHVVEYSPPGQELSFVGILTSEKPICTADEKKVCVYFPFAYMIGGPIAMVNPEHLRPLDMPVEEALKLAATAHVGVTRPEQLEINAAKQ